MVVQELTAHSEILKHTNHSICTSPMSDYQRKPWCRLLFSTTLLLPALLSDSQVAVSLIIHGLWWTVSRQVKAHIVTMYHIVDTCPLTKFEGGLNLLHKKQIMTQSHGWNLQRLQPSRNNNHRLIQCITGADSTKMSNFVTAHQHTVGNCPHGLADVYRWLPSARACGQ